MISFAKLMREILTETMSFRQLWDVSDDKRKKRAAHVTPRQMHSRAVEAPDSWVFSYKSDGGWSTTGKRWHGYVKLLKDEIVNNRNIEIQDVDCMVDCDCPDYRYRFAYGNTEQGASETGASSWNKNSGTHPKDPSVGGMGVNVGLCKHLMSLVEYLGTKLEPVAPQPDDKPPTKVFKKKPLTQPAKEPRPADSKATTDAPQPDDSYSDSRGDSGYSDGRELQESMTPLYERIDQLVRANPTFEVTYYDED